MRPAPEEERLLARDVIGVAIRVLALWFLTQSVFFAFWAIVKTTDEDWRLFGIGGNTEIVTGAIYLLLAVILVVLAGPLARLIGGASAKASDFFAALGRENDGGA